MATKRRLSPVIIAYLAGSYAYSVVFAFILGNSGGAPSAVAFLLLAPIVWPLHIAMVCSVTAVNFGGRGSWDMNNTVSILAFAIIGTFAYFAAKGKRHAENTPNQPTEVVRQAGTCEFEP